MGECPRVRRREHALTASSRPHHSKRGRVVRRQPLHIVAVELRSHCVNVHPRRRSRRTGHRHRIAPAAFVVRTWTHIARRVVPRSSSAAIGRGCEAAAGRADPSRSNRGRGRTCRSSFQSDGSANFRARLGMSATQRRGAVSVATHGVLGHPGPWTMADVEALPDAGDHARYELLSPGVLTVSPAPVRPINAPPDCWPTFWKTRRTAAVPTSRSAKRSMSKCPAGD